jgi:probable HAF family extracellular repeat protein
MYRILLCAAALVCLTGCDDPLRPDGSLGESDPRAGRLSTEVDVSRGRVVGARDLGNLGGSFALGIGINERTNVVGLSTISTQEFQFHPYLWTPDQGIRDLGTLGGDNGIAFEVNDHIQVVGSSEIAGNAAIHAFLWAHGQGMQDLGTLGGTNSNAEGVNNRSWVVGDAQNAQGQALPYIWKPRRGMRSLNLAPVGGPTSEGSGKSINEAGEVAGFVALNGFADPSSPYRAFRWTPQRGIQDLGTLGGDLSFGWGINERGDVVGQASDATGASQAFLWTQRHGIQGLGTLGGDYASAFNVNERRVVVGESLDESGRLLPFVWIEHLGMRTLPIEEVGGVEGAAVGINKKNEIAGLAFTADGGARAVLWTPRTNLLTASTEELPADFMVAAAGPVGELRSELCTLARTYRERGLHLRSKAQKACQR